MSEKTKEQWEEAEKLTLTLYKKAREVQSSDEYRIIIESHVAQGDDFPRVARLVRASLFLLVEDFVNRFSGATAATIVQTVTPHLTEDFPLSPTVLEQVVALALGDERGKSVPKGVRIIAGAIIVPHLASHLGYDLKEVVKVSVSVDEMTMGVFRGDDGV